MITGTIQFSGKTDADVRAAVEEVLRVMDAGNSSGMGGNEDGDFSFETVDSDWYPGRAVPDGKFCPTCQSVVWPPKNNLEEATDQD